MCGQTSPFSRWLQEVNCIGSWARGIGCQWGWERWLRQRVLQGVGSKGCRGGCRQEGTWIWQFVMEVGLRDFTSILRAVFWTVSSYICYRSCIYVQYKGMLIYHVLIKGCQPCFILPKQKPLYDQDGYDKVLLIMASFSCPQARKNKLVLVGLLNMISVT